MPAFIDDSKPKPKPIVCYGADTIIRDNEEEKKVSKHAKRRANKKAKQAAVAQMRQDGGNESAAGASQNTMS